IRTKPKGTFISYSTAPGEVAVDGSDGHSPFAAALADAMQQPGLDLPEVFQRVRERVLAATEERQTPWDSSSLGKSFYFLPPTESTAAPLVAANTPAETAPVQLASAEPLPAAEPEAPVARDASVVPDFVASDRALYAKPGSRLRAEPNTDAAVIAKPATN